MTWLTDLIRQHSELETPTSFWRWAGLVAISAVMKDQVYLDRGGAYKLYPNIYCILHAESGLKKGPAINLARDLVKKVNNTRMITGRSSIQGILRLLGTSESRPGGIIHKKSYGFISASELASSLVTDPAALTILTDLYDRNWNEGDWSSLLKMEQFSLKDPTITLFGGINPAHAEVFFERKDISGGFIARTFIIHETEEANINSLVYKLRNPPNRDEMVLYLKELMKLSGPFQDLADESGNPTPAGQYYDQWYNEFRREIKRQGIKDETGTLNRFGDSVLKVAMLLSLSKEPKLEIDLDSMQESVALCERFVSGVRTATIGKSRDDKSLGNRKTIIIMELLARENHQITRTMLMKKYWMHFTVSDLDDIMHSFDQAGMILTKSVGNNIIYEMPHDQVGEMSRFLDGKNR